MHKDHSIQQIFQSIVRLITQLMLLPLTSVAVLEERGVGEKSLVLSFTLQVVGKLSLLVVISGDKSIIKNKDGEDKTNNSFIMFAK